MQKQVRSLRSKLAVLTTLVLAIALVAPVASARDHYRRGSGHSGNVVGALVVGAVIGGILASATQSHDAYYDGGYYPPQPAYYPPPAPVYYQSYPAYPAYPQPVYGGGVSIGVVYSSHDGRRWDRRDQRGHYYRHYGR